MKVKFELRKVLLAFLPWLHVSLIIAPIYAYVASYVWQKEIIASYLMGLSVIFPVAVTRILITKTKKLFSFVVLSLVFSVLWFFFDPILGVLLFFMALIRLVGRFRSGNKTVFDSPHYAGLAAFTLPFVFSAAADIPSLQLISLVSALVYAMLTLLYRSLKRLDEYIEMNRSMADFPAKRVSSTTLRTVSALVAVLLAVCLVILVVNFDFFLMPEFTNPGDEIEEEMIMSSDGYSGGNNVFFGLPDISGYQLNINWVAVGKVLVSFVAAVIIIALAVVVYNLARGFSESAAVREENDIIENIRDKEEKLTAPKEKHRLVPDLSPNAAVRRKYRRAVLSENYSPEPWQSPREIETAAGIRDEVLHELYEKARYSEKGCTPEDKKLL